MYKVELTNAEYQEYMDSSNKTMRFIVENFPSLVTDVHLGSQSSITVSGGAELIFKEDDHYWFTERGEKNIFPNLKYFYINSEGEEVYPINFVESKKLDFVDFDNVNYVAYQSRYLQNVKKIRVTLLDDEELERVKRVFPNSSFSYDSDCEQYNITPKKSSKKSSKPSLTWSI
jgi:hypothetical protein